MSPLYSMADLLDLELTLKGSKSLDGASSFEGLGEEVRVKGTMVRFRLKVLGSLIERKGRDPVKVSALIHVKGRLALFMITHKKLEVLHVINVGKVAALQGKSLRQTEIAYDTIPEMFEILKEGIVKVFQKKPGKEKWNVLENPSADNFMDSGEGKSTATDGAEEARSQ